MARGDVRIAVTLACEECKRRNYQTNKSKRNDPERITLRKYCKWCRSHTSHRETRQPHVMPRNRQRARDRKAREGQPHDQIHRENIPSELDNLGQEDVFEASMLGGADGEPAEIGEAELEREAVGTAPESAPATRAERAPSGPRAGGNRVGN